MNSEDRTRRMTLCGHVKPTLEKVKWSRPYSLDDATTLGLGALLSEWQQDRAARGESFTREAGAMFFESLREFVPSLFQSWRPPPPIEPEKVEKLVDPMTGQPVANPW